MYEIQFESIFKKDFKKMKKKHKNISLLEKALMLLRQKGKLPVKYKPHKLKGNFKGTGSVI